MGEHSDDALNYFTRKRFGVEVVGEPRRKRKESTGMAEPQEEGWQQMLEEADGFIEKAEQELGLLTSGQRRDLLKDNTGWSDTTCDELVRTLDETDAERWRASLAGVSPDPQWSNRRADELRGRFYRL